MIFTLVYFVGSGIWTSRNVGKNITYFPFDNLHPALEGFIRFWTYIIIYQVQYTSTVALHLFTVFINVYDLLHYVCTCIIGNYTFSYMYIHVFTSGTKALS